MVVIGAIWIAAGLWLFRRQHRVELGVADGVALLPGHPPRWLVHTSAAYLLFAGAAVIMIEMLGGDEREALDEMVVGAPFFAWVGALMFFRPEVWMQVSEQPQSREDGGWLSRLGETFTRSLGALFMLLAVGILLHGIALAA